MSLSDKITDTMALINSIINLNFEINSFTSSIPMMNMRKMISPSKVAPVKDSTNFDYPIDDPNSFDPDSQIIDYNLPMDIGITNDTRNSPIVPDYNFTIPLDEDSSYETSGGVGLVPSSPDENRKIKINDRSSNIPSLFQTGEVKSIISDGDEVAATNEDTSKDPEDTIVNYNNPRNKEEFEASTQFGPKSDNNGSTPITSDTSFSSAKVITRDMISSSNSVTAYGHRWGITLEKMGGASIDNPFSKAHNLTAGDDGIVLGDNLLPATAFRYDTYKASIEELSFLPGININIPAGYSYSKTLTVTIMNDCQDILRAYLRAYRKSVCPTYKSAVPYKEACSKLTIYIYNRQLNLLNSYELWVIPDFSDETVSDQELKSLDVTFYVLGESDKNPAK